MTWSSVRRHLLLASAVVFLGAAAVWDAGPSRVFRAAPAQAGAESPQDDALVLHWAAAVHAQDRIAIVRSESDLVRRGGAAIPSLVRTATDSPELACDVVALLARIRSTASVTALERLHRDLGATHGPALRAAILRALAEIGGQTARDAFLALLLDEADPGVQHTAAELAQALLRPEDIASLPPQFRTRIQGDVALREDLSKLLTELSKTPSSSPTSAEWAAYLSPVYALVARTVAVERLEARADPEAIQALREAAAGDDLDTAVAAFGALCRLRSHDVRIVVKDVVLAAPEERLAAMLDVLGTYGDSAYVPLARKVQERSSSEHLKELADRAALRLHLR